MALTKDPDAVLDYTFDWSAWLADGETIISHEAVVEVGDAVIDSTTATTTSVVVWLSGGTLDTNVELRCRVTTSDGRTDDRTIVILIRTVFAADGCEDWPIIGYTAPAGIDPTIEDAAKSSAQMFLRGVTAGRLGTCTRTQRFQIRETASGTCRSNLLNGNCCAIRLPSTPVQSVLAVRVDGVLLDPSEYALLGGSRLGRTSGCWPQSPDCEQGRVQVTYASGIPLQPGTSYYAIAGAAMGEVTREYVAALSGQTCKLPSRFVAVARQGVSTTALDPALFLRLGLTGMPLTDNLIRTVNPNGHKRRPRVVPIDGPRLR